MAGVVDDLHKGVPEICNQKSPVVFVFDRVMHYHRATLSAIEARLGSFGIEFCVISSKDAPGATGRVAETANFVRNHGVFELRERNVSGFMLRRQLGLLLALKRLKPAVIVSAAHSGTLTEWQALLWARRNGVRRVAWQCGYEYNEGVLKSIVLSQFVPLFNFHLCYHTNAQRYALRHGARANQTLVMHNTIDECGIVVGDKQHAKAELVQRFPQLAGKKLILYVGAVLEEKRLELAFDALQRLGHSDATLLIVGDGPHLGVLKHRYADRSDWLSVGQVIQGVGVYFDAADVFVLPGTGGLAINEAMAHRLPVISGCADGSADDLVIDGVTGFRLREASAEALADRLREWLASPVRASEMGERAEQRIRGDLSFTSFIDRVVGVLAQQHAQACAGGDR